MLFVTLIRDQSSLISSLQRTISSLQNTIDGLNIKLQNFEDGSRGIDKDDNKDVKSTKDVILKYMLPFWYTFVILSSKLYDEINITNERRRARRKKKGEERELYIVTLFKVRSQKSIDLTITSQHL